MVSKRPFSAFFTFLCLIVVCESHCQKAKPCHCITDAGDEIDLSPIWGNGLKTNLTASKDNITFYFNACHNLPVGTSTSSLYYVNSTINATYPTVQLGNITDGVFAVSPFSTNDYSIFDLIYTIKSVHITLACVHISEDNLVIASLDTDIRLILYSKHACLHHLDEDGLSAGSVLLILFFTFAAIYFIGGCLVNFFARGASGLDVIPNLRFWAELPSLVKDGFQYLVNGCKVTQPSDAYNSI